MSLLPCVDLVLPFLFEEEKVPLILCCPSFTASYAGELQEIRDCAFLLDFWSSHFYWDLASRQAQLQRDFEESFVDQDSVTSD